MASFIERLKDRIKDLDRVSDPAVGTRKAPDPPASEAQVAAAERTLGFVLPSTLRRIYIEVANGGFGPAYGLYGVPTKITQARRDRFWEGHWRRVKLPRDDPNWWPADVVPACRFDIVDLHQTYWRLDDTDPAWRWPAKLIPACELGCGMYMCIDCNEPAGAIIQLEPNPREAGEPLDDFLVPIAPSIEAWLSAWLDNKDDDMAEAAWRKAPLWKRLGGDCADVD
jgi:hypothetical protein